MSETPKKTGFFSRLFSRGDPQSSVPEPVVDVASHSPAHAPFHAVAVEEDASSSILVSGDKALLVEPSPDVVVNVEGKDVPALSFHTAAAQVAAADAAPAVEVDDQPLTPPLVDVPVKGVSEGAPVSWFGRLKAGLSRTSSALTDNITKLFTTRKLDAQTLEDLEDSLIQADLGLATSAKIVERLSAARLNKDVSPAEVREALAEEVQKVLEPVAQPLILSAHQPEVILMIGVNGAGKTTTIGKLGAKFSREGKKVMLAAGDTFRAAAVEQLVIWGQRIGAEVVRRPQGADSAALAFDALQAAKTQKADVLLIDTAGRLQNKTALMAELEKIIRTLKKQDSALPHRVLLVLDATTGQNALSQVDIFSKVAGVSGLVMTKLDGTARGGILVAISATYQLPVHYIGVGEGVDDLEPFTASDFARAIAGL